MPKLKIKKGDNVVVISGRDKGKRGEVLRVFPDENRLIVQGVHVARRHTKQRLGEPGGIVDKELTIHVSNVAHIDPQSGKPTRVGYRILDDGRKVRVARRSGEMIIEASERAAMTTRLQEHYQSTVKPALMQEFGYTEPDAGAAAGQDRRQHGRRRGGAGRQEDRRRGRRSDRDHRPAPGRDPRQALDRDLQAAREHADRRQGDLAPRPHVRVPRPADHRGAAAGARLPRRVAAQLRRARQLRARPQGAAGVPRNRLRQGRYRARHGHRHRDDGARPMPRPGPC